MSTQWDSHTSTSVNSTFAPIQCLNSVRKELRDTNSSPLTRNTRPILSLYVVCVFAYTIDCEFVVENVFIMSLMGRENDVFYEHMQIIQLNFSEENEIKTKVLFVLWCFTDYIGAAWFFSMVHSTFFQEMGNGRIRVMSPTL